MSQRTEQMTRQMVIGLVLMLGFAVASFTAIALGASLCDFTKESQNAESELQELEGLRSNKAANERLRDDAWALLHGDPSNPDPDLRTGLIRRQEELEQRLQGVRNAIDTARSTGRMADLATFQQTETEILRALQDVNTARSNAEGTANMAQTSLTRLTTLEGKEAELKNKVAQFKDDLPERRRRFQAFMNCYQLALSMKAFSKSTQTGMILSPNQMDDQQNASSPRSQVSTAYNKAYVKFFKTDFTDEEYGRLGTALRKKLGEIGGQFFDGAGNALARDMGHLGQDTGGSRQAQLEALRSQFTTVVQRGDGPICDMMRNLVNQGEQIIWDSLPQPIYINSDAYFTRKVTPDFTPQECYTPQSVTVP